MIKGIEAYNPGFLADLNSIENRLAKENNEISSGIRVQEPSDDPGAIAPILDTQNAIAQVTQVQKNLTLANTTAQTADSALQNASTILDRLVSIAAEGANSTTSATSEQALALQVQNLEQELVSAANTSANGQYVFGGDHATVAPYSFNWSYMNGAATQGQFSLSGNLNASGGSPVLVSVPVVDSLGQTHTLQVTFTPAGANTWTYQVTIPPTDLSLAQSVSYTTNGSATVTVANTTGISVGQTVSGSGIPAGTTVVSISGNTVTLSNNATASGIASLAFGTPASAPVLASGTLSFDASGNLTTSNTSPITMHIGNLADGADDMILNWNLFSPSGNGLITQTAAPSSLTPLVAPAANTTILRDADGNPIVPGLLASQIFDSQSGGPASDIFADVYALGQLLTSGNQEAIQQAALNLKSALAQLSQAETQYGDVENWISQANQNASQKLTNLQANLSALRDADIPSVATQLTLDETALNAALSAHATLGNKTLFDYLG
jgi:flagellin-like hook-associated protein FlgL